MSEWIYPVRVESNKVRSFNVREIKFGEGHAQRRPNRLDETRRRWNITCDLPWADSVAADAFLAQRAGCFPFWFADPHTGEPILVICKEDVTLTPRAGGVRVVLSTVFEEYD